ncbi:putative insertion element IS1016 transposase [Leptothrix cholodnii SP-6]|uniref:Putative insertion element IS1016 transposase n=1 Tax=Leptothrix cholodnii (strain ATCC 51168 / LMG 8142 / SP-6) TaxID=395495 RepID=B1Y716_LEPCP|nr:transposase [Leptothrix cholodnii]ACB33643.1 putative insertion element IS1016 transposase [Leptothrix cholodnii SP-6]
MSEEQSQRLFECFVAGTPARPAAETVGVNRNTARLYYHRLRETIAHHIERDGRWRDEPGATPTLDGRPVAPVQAGDAPVVRIVPVAGLLERDGRVHIVPIAEPATAPWPGPAVDAIVCFDQTISPTEPAEMRDGRMRVELGDALAGDLPRRKVVRAFWQSSARLLRRFNGVPRQHLLLYLKECEWRFNDGTPEARMNTLRLWFMRSDRRSRNRTTESP